MDFRFVLLEPKGRLAPSPFAQGYILLTAAMLIITIVSTFLIPGSAVLQYALIFPYLCVFSKRFHDAGLSGWLWLLALGVFLVLNSLLTILLMPGLSPDAWRIYAEVSELSQEQGMEAGMEALAQQGMELTRAAGLSSVAAFLITSAGIGFVVYRLRTDPRPNRHGPPPAGTAAPDSRP
ncbi:MAG: DUF805 domain-containing protein [Hyphomonas sp.]